MWVYTLSVCFIFYPLAIIYITIWMNQSSNSVSFIIFPVAFIHWTVRPDLSASTLSNISSFAPLSCKASTIHHSYGTTLFTNSKTSFVFSHWINKFFQLLSAFLKIKKNKFLLRHLDCWNYQDLSKFFYHLLKTFLYGYDFHIKLWLFSVSNDLATKLKVLLEFLIAMRLKQLYLKYIIYSPLSYRHCHCCSKSP